MASKQDMNRMRRAKGSDGKESQRLQSSHSHNFIGPVGGSKARVCSVQLRIPVSDGSYTWTPCGVKESD